MSLPNCKYLSQNSEELGIHVIPPLHMELILAIADRGFRLLKIHVG
jgi:hypothetical protein